MATVTTSSFFLRWRSKPRRFSNASSSSSSACILRRMCRRSLSNLLSPGPRVPMPPPRRERLVPCPARRGRRYFSCASSTCNLPSLVFARWAKMSRIRVVRSITAAPRAFSRFFCWAGESSWSKMTSSTWLFCTNSASSSTLPIRVAGSGRSFFWMTLPITLAPADFASSSSSSIERCASYSPVSMAASTAVCSSCLFSYILCLPVVWYPFT